MLKYPGFAVVIIVCCLACSGKKESQKSLPVTNQTLEKESVDELPVDAMNKSADTIFADLIQSFNGTDEYYIPLQFKENFPDSVLTKLMPPME